MWRSRLIKLIMGLAIALILSTLIFLGLRIFIPPPEYPSYSYRYDSCAPADEICYSRQAEESQRKQEEYQEIYKEYGGKIFIAANIVGLIVLLLGIFVFLAGLGTNVSAGILLAGVFGIAMGYTLGWEGADDIVKFGVGLIVALIVIAGAVIFNRKNDQAPPIVV